MNDYKKIIDIINAKYGMSSSVNRKKLLLFISTLQVDISEIIECLSKFETMDQEEILIHSVDGIDILESINIQEKRDNVILKNKKLKKQEKNFFFLNYCQKNSDINLYDVF